MTSKIAIAPYSVKLRTGRTNPKNYPEWPEVVDRLKAQNYEILQLGVQGEVALSGVDQHIVGFPFPKVREIIQACVTWVSVDSWLPHFCYSERLKSGIVLFGQSDPLIFGYPENNNLLKDRRYLREWPFDAWEAAEYRPDVFVSPNEVVAAVNSVVALSGGYYAVTS